MNVELILQDPLSVPSPLLVLLFPQGGDAAGGVLASADALVGGELKRALERGDLKGKKEETLLLFPRRGHRPGHLAEATGPERVLMVGAGAPGELDAETLRRLMGRAVRVAEGLRLKEISAWLDPSWPPGEALAAQAMTEGAVLAAWRFQELKTTRDDDGPSPELSRLVLLGQGDGEAARLGLRIGLAQARGENLARTLQARPGNVATPTHLADEARRLAKEHGLKVTVLGPRELEKEKMGALLAVARGSEEEPKLIALEYRGGRKGDRPIGLVGKGLTFDTGGISIKPASGMEDMKYDMSGGAAVLGVMQAAAELTLPVNLVGIIPSTENLLSGKAVKPGDVVRTREGKTVEVINTDAEGRLILADALSFARTFDPVVLVDCATLTGAALVALGNHASAVLGNDDELIRQLRDAGDRSGQRCWPLPLWKEYRDQLDSNVADLMNVGGRNAGAITAAAFLKEFVGEVPWAHLDIAGTAYGEGKLSYQRKGGYGVPTRLLLEWVRSRLT
jgi:leucyl aminopeptidase